MRTVRRGTHYLLVSATYLKIEWSRCRRLVRPPPSNSRRRESPPRLSHPYKRAALVMALMLNPRLKAGGA